MVHNASNQQEGQNLTNEMHFGKSFYIDVTKLKGAQIGACVKVKILNQSNDPQHSLELDWPIHLRPRFQITYHSDTPTRDQRNFPRTKPDSENRRGNWGESSLKGEGAEVQRIDARLRYCQCVPWPM